MRKRNRYSAHPQINKKRIGNRFIQNNCYRMLGLSRTGCEYKLSQFLPRKSSSAKIDYRSSRRHFDTYFSQTIGIEATSSLDLYQPIECLQGIKQKVESYNDNERSTLKFLITKLSMRIQSFNG